MSTSTISLVNVLARLLKTEGAAMPACFRGMQLHLQSLSLASGKIVADSLACSVESADDRILMIHGIGDRYVFSTCVAICSSTQQRLGWANCGHATQRCFTSSLASSKAGDATVPAACSSLSHTQSSKLLVSEPVSHSPPDT